MRKRVSSLLSTFGITAGLVLSLSVGSIMYASEATPEPVEMTHPSHIHAGACPEVGDVVVPLNNVEPVDKDAGTPEVKASPAMDSTPASDMDSTLVTGTDETSVKLSASTTFDGSIDDLLAGEHAVNVHLSPDEMSVYIACGDITGTVEDGKLVVDLKELNDSGVSGTATFTDNGDGTVTLDIEAVHELKPAESTPVS